MNFGIIGAGLIGQKRGAALRELGDPVVAVADASAERAGALATQLGAAAESSAEALLKRADVDAVVIATFHDSLGALAARALEAGKHVLVEKPAGRNPAELRALGAAAAARPDRVLRVGFNHRFHPALLEAHRLVHSGELGPLMYIRARYGHGGRLGYEQEWRARPEVSGGGELIDQGSHLIDLAMWIGGEMRLEFGHAQTFFWKMPVDDNGFLLLRSPDGKRAAFLHASCTEWKNLFNFEIFCARGKIDIQGLGRSYGTEELRVYRMTDQMGPPPVATQSFPGEDTSWKSEISAFLAAIEGRPSEIATLTDALRVNERIYETYARSGYPFAQA